MPKKKITKKVIHAKSKKKGISTLRFSHPLLISSIGLLLLLIAANVQTTQLLSTNSQKVLGEDEKSEEDKQAEEVAKQAEEAQKENEKQAEEQQREEVKKTEFKNPESSKNFQKSKTESVIQNKIKVKTETQDSKRETEIETIDGQKIKTKIEDDGTTKVEIESGKIKLKYVVENGLVVLKAENEQGEEVELEKDELEELENEVDDELESENIEIQSTSNNKLAVTKNNISALTNFPLSIDTETKQLIVTTPAGQKIVTILPDVAVQNLLATGIINTVASSSAGEDTKDQLGEVAGIVELEVQNNEIVYKVQGEKNQKMLGFIPVTTPVTVFVSADTGKAISKQQTIFNSIIGFLSF